MSDTRFSTDGERAFMNGRHRRLAERGRCPFAWNGRKSADVQDHEHHCKVRHAGHLGAHVCECGATRVKGKA